MSYREFDIMHETGACFVLRDRKVKPPRYTVYVNGVTHAVSDSAYALDPDGLSIAVARCNYLARKGKGVLNHGFDFR